MLGCLEPFANLNVLENDWRPLCAYCVVTGCYVPGEQPRCHIVLFMSPGLGQEVCESLHHVLVGWELQAGLVLDLMVPNVPGLLLVLGICYRAGSKAREGT